MNHADDLPTETTSTSLLSRVRGNDTIAWKRLTGIYGPLVYGWCRSFGVPAQDTSDILQDVFVAVHRALPSFHHNQAGDSFRGWLWTITRNRVHDHYRLVGKNPIPVGGSEAQMRWAELPAAEPQASASELGQIDSVLLRGLEYVRVEFREQTWKAFWRSTVEGIATAEVAEELSMSTGAVRKAKFRVLRRLREELDGLL